MAVFVVDTNVAIAANGRDTHADLECRLRCISQLRIMRREIIAIDDGGLIVNEYRRRLNFSGAPGAGDAFWKYLFDHQYRADHVRRVSVTPSDDERKGFEQLPENTFDRSDQKFLAVAVVAGATVLNATDSDWSEHHALMDDLGVEVHELCPQHIPAKTRPR